MERCLSGHLYAVTRGDEECPVCAANKVMYKRIAELEKQLEAERTKVALATKALRKVLYQGRSLDCLSCVFKDKIATDALAALQAPEVGG